MVLLGASFVNALVDVLAIIGIILVGGFLIFFLGDLVLSILDPNYKRFGRRSKEKKEETKEEVKALPQEKQEALTFKAEEPAEEEFKFDEPVKEEVKEEIKEEVKEDVLADLRAEEEIFRANMMKEIEARQARREEERASYNEFFFEDDDLKVFDDLDENLEAIEIEPEEVAEEVVEEVAAPEVVEETEEVVEEAVEETVVENAVNEELEALRQELEAERRKFEEEKAALISEKEELARKLEDNEVVETAPQGNLEEYEARLEMLKDRLAANDKELRKVKKDFLPLKRVAKTLEADEKKLRRKEAIVAKQKVILYGVNNIGDIDEEKAKKLEEDLDILEGFRLSVQHCQEVMDANKDRYPILERTYNILTENNENLKKDIEETEKAIAALQADVEEEVVEAQEEVAEEVVETTETVDTDNE